MRNFVSFRSLAPALLLLLAAIAYTPAADAAAFALFDGIPGEATDKDHAGWINIDSISESIRSSIAIGEKTTGSEVQLDDISLTKIIDRSSVLLRDRLARGEVIPNVVIELTSSYSAVSRATYFKYELKNVVITSFQFSAVADEGSPPTETLTLAFDEITWTYTIRDNSGGSSGEVTTTWTPAKGL